MPKPSGDAAGVRGELAALGRAIDAQERDAQRLTSRREQLTQRRLRLAEEIATAEAQLALGEADHDAAVVTAEADRDAARSALAKADEAARRSRQRARRVDGPLQALAQALDAARSRAGAERIAQVEGTSARCSTSSRWTPGGRPPSEKPPPATRSSVVMADPAAARRALDALERGRRRRCRARPVRRPVATMIR
ncbi:MAG: hypothetical protein IPF88_00010 [Candidatus Microthrix sp.]|nr:hypothetical protein [Candidatus Microthrix sp.]MBK6437008.1 hypothetical protein [Candidatus Microthrix sp.]